MSTRDEPVALHEQPETVVRGSGVGTVQPRVLVGLVLIACGLVWAVFRGLEFYGIGPVDLAYDLDQPPLVLLLVGAWLLYRSRS